MTEHGINTHSLETQIQDSNRYLPLLGRVLIGAPFVMSGLGKLAAYHATVGYISSAGLPSRNWGTSSLFAWNWASGRCSSSAFAISTSRTSCSRSRSCARAA